MNSLLATNLIYNSSSYPFYDENFRLMLDPHMHWLKTAGNVQPAVPVPTSHMGTFIGDFYAILQKLDIPAKYHRIILLMNGYTNPIQYDGTKETILIPDTDIMDEILMVYNTGKSKLMIGIPGE